MALLNLFFDVTSKRLVSGLDSSVVYVLPELHQEDSLAIDLMVVQRIAFASPPYFSVVAIGSYALFIAIGTPGHARASQGTWTKNGDNTLFSGLLALDTTLLNGLADNSSQLFEIRLFDGTSYFRGQFPCTIRKSVALSGALSDPVADTALGRLEAAEIYMPYELPAGRGITLVSADGTKKILRYLDNDGTIREVNLT